MDIKTRKKTDTVPLSRSVNPGKISFWDFLVILAMGGLLLYGISPQLFRLGDDAARYECYAVAFWHGTQATKKLPTEQCAFLTQINPPLITQAAFVNDLKHLHMPDSVISFFASQSSSASFHALPHEYPALALIPFSASLLVPAHNSQIAFALVMILLAIGIYFVMLKSRSRAAAIMFAAYLVVGGWVTAAGRFDLIPASLTFLAFLASVKQRWLLAYMLLAIATMIKLYPVYLLPAFLVAQQSSRQVNWRHWYDGRRWAALSVYIGVCVLILLVSLGLNVEGTLAPFGYFKDRPVQVESLSSSVLWLSSLITHQHLSYEFTFGSLNIVNTSGMQYSLPGTLCLIGGVLYTLWLQWKQKIDLATALLLTLLIVIVTTKVFSPQYLIWVIPFAAYIGEARLRWLIPWIALGLLTTWIYPYIYEMVPLSQVGYLPIFYPVTTIRNFLFLGCAIALLITATRKPALALAK